MNAPAFAPSEDALGVDTHVHLDDAAFDRDRDDVVVAARRAGIVQLINVGYRPDRWDASAALTAAHPSIFHMLGVHPQHADELTADTERELRRRLATGAAVAVGEIGLDYFRPGVARDVQRSAFERQIEIAREAGLAIVIHQRSAEPDILDVLESATGLPPVVLHSFEGTTALAGLAVERGFAIGVGGLATRPTSDALRRVLATVPVGQIVLETDAPYLSPAGTQSRRNEPKNVGRVAERLAPIWSLTPRELLQATGQTARRLFGLPEPASAARNLDG